MECSHLPAETEELSILLTDDSEITELNRSYRGKNEPTDVLSFSQLEGQQLASHQTSLGDIVISLERVLIQSKKAGIPFEEELLQLLIHGILHLFGFDHENVTEEEVKQMEQLEKKLFIQHTDTLSSFQLQQH